MKRSGAFGVLGMYLPHEWHLLSCTEKRGWERTREIRRGTTHGDRKEMTGEVVKITGGSGNKTMEEGREEGGRKGYHSQRLEGGVPGNSRGVPLRERQRTSS